MSIKENQSFLTFDNNKCGLLFSDSENQNYPLSYYNMINGSGLVFKKDHSYFGYVYEGLIIINDINLQKGMFFSLNKMNININNSLSKTIIIEVPNLLGSYLKSEFQAYNIYGGPVEKKGRLKYIDGCTDSLLISPVKKGDPCLNHLHFPKQINQTLHTHPSHRIGIVANGAGECITPFGNTLLEKGMIFIIKEWNGKDYSTGLDGLIYENGIHAFKTQDSSMDVIAFHPDSDFGPEDDNHPMINRTIVNGSSAKNMIDIRTK